MDGLPIGSFKMKEGTPFTYESSSVPKNSAGMTAAHPRESRLGEATGLPQTPFLVGLQAQAGQGRTYMPHALSKG